MIRHRRITILLALAGATLLSSCARMRERRAVTRANDAQSQWVATWSPAQSATAARPAAGTPDRVPTYANATIREIVRTTLGGDHVRIRLTNEYGDQPVVVGSVHLALRSSESSTSAGSDRMLTFGGKTSVTIRTGATVVSDPIAYAVPTLGDLAISLYLPDSARTSTRHALGLQTTYVSKRGDQAASTNFAADTTLRSWIFLAGVDVTNAKATGAIVTIGNSITDGAASTADANRRWPDVLAQRLLTAKGEPPKSVVNAGISGNRVLTFGAGPSLVSRFDRDVVLQPGVTHVIVLEGINDISRGGAETVSAEDVIFGLRQVAQRAHEHGLIIYGATLTPAERMAPENQAKRDAVNAWIRTGGAFDGVIDFDAATRDPSQPNRFLPVNDSGDHLHPSDAGYKAMGEAIDLVLFRTKTARK
jgi:lysophospholipase L1-like esterase